MAITEPTRHGRLGEVGWLAAAIASSSTIERSWRACEREAFYMRSRWEASLHELLLGANKKVRHVAKYCRDRLGDQRPFVWPASERLVP